ncbi:MAG: substrate-binding domain-containing protein [Burkholderiales bacterium]|nr:substrate-binding domain-containing protein [Phycisphaerae bacterium]
MVLFSGCDKADQSTAAPGEAKKEVRKIAVIPKGTTHIFWRTVEAGARDAAKEAGVEMIWKGPLKEDDRAQQIQVVESFLTQGVSGIVLAPLDQNALLKPVQAAGAKNIPVVIIDSSLSGEAGKDFASLVATDNKAGGKLAGDEMVRLTGGKAKLVLLRYLEGSASTQQREEGFVDATKGKEMTYLVDNKYSGATSAEAQTAALNLGDKLKEADAVYCPNESSTYGMLLALKQLKLAGKIKFIGFDASPPLLEALRAGEIHALVAQNPKKMGYLGVKTLIQKLDGVTVPPMVDTGCVLITKDNLETPEVKEILANQ